MPFRSEKQRRYLFLHEPEVAHKFAHEYGSTPRPKKKRAKPMLDALRKKK